MLALEENHSSVHAGHVTLQRPTGLHGGRASAPPAISGAAEAGRARARVPSYRVTRRGCRLARRPAARQQHKRIHAARARALRAAEGEHAPERGRKKRNQKKTNHVLVPTFCVDAPSDGRLVVHAKTAGEACSRRRMLPPNGGKSNLTWTASGRGASFRLLQAPADEGERVCGVGKWPRREGKIEPSPSPSKCSKVIF